jgi:hypothetical protein
LTIALYAPHLGGHRDYWLQHILSTAVEGQIRISIYTCQEDFYERQLAQIGSSTIKVIIGKNPVDLFSRWRSDIENSQTIGVCWDADQMLSNFLFARGEYRLLILRPYLEEKSFLGITRYIVKNLLMIILGSRRSIQVARLSIPFAMKSSRKLYWVRDNFNTEGFHKTSRDSQIPYELKGVPESCKMITVLGHLDARKNPMKAYQIVTEIKRSFNKNVLLVFAGEQNESFKREIEGIKNFESVVQINRKLTDNELAGVIKASKCILLVYSNHGASGLVLNSLVVGTPVLLQGGKNWANLQKAIGGILRVERQDFETQVKHVVELIHTPKESKFQELKLELMPNLGDFLLGEKFVLTNAIKNPDF